MSTGLSPVTHTAEVERNSASASGRAGPSAAWGSRRTPVPVAITAAKLSESAAAGSRGRFMGAGAPS